MKKGLSLLLSLLLFACTTNQPIDGTAVDDMNVALHQGIHENETLDATDKDRRSQAISKALLPDVKLHSPQRNVLSRRFDIAVKNVPARTFFAGLVEGTPINMVVSPEIVGNITLNLKQVTVEQVLQTLESAYGYAYNPIPGGFEILPNTLKTQIYTVNYLELERRGRSRIILSSGEVTQSTSGGTTSTTNSPIATSTSITTGNNVNNTENVIGHVETVSSIDFWRQLTATLEIMLGITPERQNSNRVGNGINQNPVPPTGGSNSATGRSVSVNPVAGVVVVRATPKEHKQIEAYLDLVQNSMNRQVILEAKILEVTLRDQYQMGIDWKIFGANLNAIRSFPGTDIKNEDFPDAFTIGIKWATDFTTTIRALELQGNVQVLSSPRVATMNNQVSAIKVGNDQFFVSQLNPTTNVTTAGVVTNSNPTPSLSPFFSGITLDVTPQIDAHGDVTLHIHPSVSLVTEQSKTIEGAGVNGRSLTVPLARSDIRESDTIVHARNGQVVVIGGLMENQTQEDVAQLPFFGNVPFLGTLFRNTKQQSRKSELVILIKPTVITPKTATKDLIESTQQIQRLKRGFHIGSRPDIFGTEGEEPVSFGPPAGYYSQPRH
ncbi:type IV pilus (Tfp) assembly protein PilQ (plasmid) [Legionella adelaidensis]|uniref:Type IV pilus (Tfp) assembly protein PilQ n=1 Tax=Legionella adelaidensis TaxID=45056 RepID=A0A0W0R100_9GAMM|nr:pilus (MSHA type) biogenesis protein MshL [Legionella adelaidensis]KTC64617.1 type IV pilus (Tfp) assembly protein PilQ [Legionella adelaidensis]VEH86084.1 type IV pilus (Tfp) assembly protein PilQ [Legionella adelaidensis]